MSINSEIEAMPKISLIPINHKEIQPLMELAFSDDDDLLHKFTPVPNDTLANCIARCMTNVNEMFEGLVYADSIKCAYKIELEDRGVKTDIGYTITAKTEGVPNELYSCGINIHYRSKKIVLAWMGELKKVLGDCYWIALYKQNSRAINFFERNGFTKFVDESMHFVSLCNNYQKVKTEILCP